MKETLTVILNRNLGLVTNRLVEKIFKYNKDYTDIYVLDAGSKQNKMSKYTNYSVRTKSAKKNGLRFNRGMNYALSKLYLEKQRFQASRAPEAPELMTLTVQVDAQVAESRTKQCQGLEATAHQTQGLSILHSIRARRANLIELRDV